MSDARELLRELVECRQLMRAKNWIIDPDEQLSIRYQKAWEAAEQYHLAAEPQQDNDAGRQAHVGRIAPGDDASGQHAATDASASPIQQGEVAALREALRRFCISRHEAIPGAEGFGKCYVCNSAWPIDEPEDHASYCLASLSAGRHED